MASFCSKCGTPAAGKFCPACGAAVGAGPVPPPLSAPIAGPVSSPTSAAGTSAATKIILIVVGAVVLLGCIGVAGLVYVGYRAKQKIAELKQEYAVTDGASGSSSSGSRVFSPSKGTGCQLLEGQEAAGILGVAVERVEFTPNGPDGSEWCRYWVSADERKRLARAEIASGISAVSNANDKTSTAAVEKLIGGALGAAIEASGDNHNDDFAFSIQLWRSGGKSQWEKIESAKSGVKDFTGVDFGDLTGTQQIEGVGDRAMVLPAGHSIMVLKGDTFFLLGFQQFVPGREKTTALARAVVGRV